MTVTIDRRTGRATRTDSNTEPINYIPLAVHMSALDELEGEVVKALRESWDAPSVLYRKD